MSVIAAPLVLASASPRRREILGALGIALEVVPSGVEERQEPGETPVAYVERLAAAKASEVARRIAGPTERFVLGADTTVVVAGEILEKPVDDDDARRMIERLAGRSHEVITGVSLASTRSGTIETMSVTTEVVFRALDAAEIDGYVASGEGRDKAGAYAVQGIGSGLVESIRGSYANVVGLPAAETVLLLRRAGVLRRWP